jgi:hypothetical protein
MSAKRTGSGGGNSTSLGMRLDGGVAARDAPGAASDVGGSAGVASGPFDDDAAAASAAAAVTDASTRSPCGRGGSGFAIADVCGGSAWTGSGVGCESILGAGSARGAGVVRGAGSVAATALAAGPASRYAPPFLARCRFASA